MTATTIATEPVIVEPVDDNQAMQAFIHLPWDLYDKHSLWVPPLKSDLKSMLDPAQHDPFYQHAQVRLFLAKQGGQPVGRVAAIINDAHLEAHQDGVGFFGFFESQNDPDIAAALFDAAGEWLRANGLRVMRGPASPSINHEAGLLVGDFAVRPSIMMPYNHPYYMDLLENSGFTKVRELRCYMVDLQKTLPTPRQEQMAERLVTRSSITLRRADLKQLRQEAEIIRIIFNEAWKGLWGHVPMTAAEGVTMADQLKQIIDERLVLIGSIDGKPMAIALALPDFNVVLKHLNGRLTPLGMLKALYFRRKIRRLRVIAFGVLQEYRRQGLELPMMLQLCRNAVAAGYEEMELSWILEDNATTTALMENHAIPRSQTYAMYERALG